MQERCNEAAAITLEVYVGRKRNAGQIVFIGTLLLREDTWGLNGSSGGVCWYRHRDGNYANLDVSVEASTSAPMGNDTYW